MEQSFIEYSLGKDASSAVLWVYPVRKPRGKAIIMCPGGGFNQIASDHEGRDFAAWFNNQGITYAVLNYRMPHGDVEVIRVPWDYDFNGLEFDGLFISNGPGDPDTCDAAVQNIRKAMKNEKLPIFGICMGNQLLSKAGGAKIYKLKYGHRSHNQPVRMVGTERCFITSQNHGYAVDNNTLGADWEPLFINMNDGSNEGIKHKTNPWFSAQFHPEAASGPTDTEFLFDEFVNLLK